VTLSGRTLDGAVLLIVAVALLVPAPDWLLPRLGEGRLMALHVERRRCRARWRECKRQALRLL
jgi:hypothetical protein